MSARLVKDINPDGSSSPEAIISVDGILFFAADLGNETTSTQGSDSNNSNDPSDSGSEDIDDNTNDSEENANSDEENGDIDGETNIADEVTTEKLGTGSGLFKSDGTEGGTVLLKSFSSVSDLVEVNGEVFFIAGTESGFQLWKTDGTSGGTQQVKDLYPGADPNFPQDIFELDGVLYYSANDTSEGKYPRDNGYEIWRRESEGVGSRFFRNLIPDVFITSIEYDVDAETGERTATVTTETYENDSFPRDFTSLNGNLFFTAYSSSFYYAPSQPESSQDSLIGGLELWFSDGTEAGTKPVNINQQTYRVYDPVAGAYVVDDNNLPVSDPNFFFDSTSASSFPRELTPFNDELYFVANDGIHGFELWSISDKGNNPQLIEDMRLGNISSSPEELTVVNDNLYFTADIGSGRELFILSSTSEQPQRVSASGSQPKNLTAIDDTLYYSARSDLGRELWKANGEQAEFVQDINPGTGSSTPTNFQLVKRIVQGKKQKTLYFTADDGKKGIEMWSLDLTTNKQTLSRKTDIQSGPASGDPRSLINSDEILFFTADDGQRGRELWTLGPAILGPNGGAGAGISTIQVKENQKSVYQFTAADNEEGQWSINGGVDAKQFKIKRSSGSLRFKQKPNYEQPEDDDRDNTYQVVVRLTEPDTGLISDQYVNVEVLNVEESVPDDGIITEDPNIGSPDTPDDTPNNDGNNTSSQYTSELIKNIRKGSSGSNPAGLTALKNQLIFSADNGKKGVELWRSKGKKKSTTLIKNINPGSENSNPSEFQSFKKFIYFSADNGRKGVELWRSNGRKSGTNRLTDINPGPSSSTPTGMTPLDKGLLFSADDGQHGRELWSLDPSDQTVSLVKNINSETGSAPRYLTAFERKIYFSAEGDTYGRELWVSDGSRQGTRLAVDLNPGGFSSDPQDLAIFQDYLYFTAETYYGGRQVWRSDGTSGGTVKLSAVSSQTIFSAVEDLTATRDRLFLTAQTTQQMETALPDNEESTTNIGLNSGETISAREQLGRELWTSNGSIDGLKLVLDINPGSGSSNPTGMTPIGNSIYFSADDGTHGEELWVSDGTRSGTERLTDLNKGAKNSSPRDITELNGSIYFSGIKDNVGRELWRLNPADKSGALARVVSSKTGSSTMRATRETKDEFIFNLTKQFGHRQADTIINFQSDDGDQIHLDQEIFQGLTSINLVTVSSKRQLKAQQTQDSNLIYFEPKGELYFNRNGNQTGYGNNAGLFAVFKNQPDLLESDFRIV